MDPSEFEDTIIKNSDVVSAGALEELFAAKPKFTPADLSKEISDLHLQIFNVQECITKWTEFSFDALKEELHGKALKVAESKEVYVARKKLLAGKIKNFTKTFLADDVHSVQESWVEPCKSVITDFKADFDLVSESAKYTELCFLAVYKIISDIADPKDIIQSCLEVCLRCHEALKTSVEQLGTAADLLEARQNQQQTVVEFPRFGSSAHLDDLSKVQDQLEKERQGKEQLIGDIATFRNRSEPFNCAKCLLICLSIGLT
jgi:hypothetical protein